MLRKMMRYLNNDDKNPVNVTDLPDIVVHFGAPKTGSSAIQSFCRSHHDDLEDLGLYYPHHQVDENLISGGHSLLAQPLLEGNISQAQEVLKAWLDEAKSRKKCLLISSEALFLKSGEFKSIVPDLDVKVVALFRNPVELLASSHNQVIKRNFSTRKLKDLCINLPPNMFTEFVGSPFLEWADQFSDENCHFAPYQKVGENAESAEKVFLQLLGVNNATIEKLVDPNTTLINRSYVSSALELKRILNTVLPDMPRDIDARVDWSLQQYSDRAVDESPPSLADIPSEVRDVVVSRFKEGVRPLLDRFPGLRLIEEQLDEEISSPSTNDSKCVELCKPLNKLEEKYPEDFEAVRDQVERLINDGRSDYLFLKLADLLGVDFDNQSARTNMDRFSSFGLSDAAKNVVLSENSQEADYLREWGFFLEEMGLIEDALVVMERAKQKRPGGIVIVDAVERLKSKKGGE